MTLIADAGISFFCIEVKQTDCTFQFNKYFSEKPCILRGRINNASVVFLKSVSTFLFSEASLTVGPVPDPETSPSDADDTLPDVFSHQKFMLGTGDSKPDYTNFRFHLWKSMHSFSDKCEPRTREFVPLFFRFLK